MQAGKMLASKIVTKYHDEDCAILALDDGGVIVGAQIASQLQCIIMLLLSDEIKLPLEPDALAGITSNGDFAYNSRYSTGEIEEFTSEYFNLIEQEKRTSMHGLNQLVRKGSVVNKKLLKGHNVILVSDGLKSAFSLDLAVNYLKTIEIKKLIIATPIASVKAVDRMHVAGDELYCLSVIEDYMDTPHYYDSQDIPNHDEIMKLLKSLIEIWQQSTPTAVEQ
jgi:putative phosphoribosyl transferase